jgi:hypothetical protein
MIWVQTGRGEHLVAEYETLIETTRRLLHPVRSSAGAWTVEIFGYLLLVEGGVIVIAPQGWPRSSTCPISPSLLRPIFGWWVC